MAKKAKLKFEFNDAFTFSKPKVEDISSWKDSLGSSYQGAKKVLRVTVEATHAALVNRNIRWYFLPTLSDVLHCPQGHGIITCKNCG